MSKHVLLATTEITSPTTNIIFDGYLDNTDYKYFQIVYNNVAGSTASTNYMRYVFRNGGSDITSADYNRHFTDSSTSGSGSTSQWLNGTYLENNVSVDNTGTSVASGDFIIYHTTDSSAEALGTFRALCSQPDGNMRIQLGGFGNNLNQTFDGIKFYTSGTDFGSGVFRLYGILN
jgi:hypothetical protein